MLIENARAHGDDDDWDELGRKSKEAWAEIKRRNREQKAMLEVITGRAVGDRMDVRAASLARPTDNVSDDNEA